MELASEASFYLIDSFSVQIPVFVRQAYWNLPEKTGIWTDGASKPGKLTGISRENIGNQKEPLWPHLEKRCDL